MKILYAIQGTGNGHVSRAGDIIPILQKHGKVDVLISGTQSDLKLPYNVNYTCNGLSFIFGKKGGIDYLETYKRSNIKKLFKEVSSLPVKEYDLIISDFEPVSAWACFLKNKPCIGLSHQNGVTCKQAPKPSKTDLIGKAVLNCYAPSTYRYGFHFQPYAKNIFTPVIRQEVRNLSTENNGHYTVYLPAYGDKQIIRFLSCFPEVQWQVFSKHNSKEVEFDNICIYPVNNRKFLESIASAEGVLCGAGFETPAEVLYLRKKLMVIPMKGQYEQQCNAAALKMLGVPVLKNLKPKQFKKLHKWLQEEQQYEIDYPDNTSEILAGIIKKHAQEKSQADTVKNVADSPSEFHNLLMKNIFVKAD
ncbi:glycosyl transferase [Chitinophagaceae bacterium LB-8]|uniref:Glycosyl transferase n=1 Tax=Paraflavisolibacter caeni TaxID=2982496 RepID=A0A9X3B6P2_9BACT|nr:glycosyltransferase family protein [Paraflavisolibacter caeni]MCU7548315.1 glycosyl transferase [Paraflavisolibacter caeni]